jgi:hypothetical protein
MSVINPDKGISKKEIIVAAFLLRACSLFSPAGCCHVIIVFAKVEAAAVGWGTPIKAILAKIKQSPIYFAYFQRMYFVPYLKRKFEYHMSDQQVLANLKKFADQDTARIANRSYLDNPFVGKFDADSFELIGKWRLQSRRRMFIPIAMGKLESVGSGSKTRLTLEVGPPPTDYIFPLIFCGVLFLFGFYKRTTGDASLLIGAIAFTCMFYIAAVVVFNATADKYVKLITEQLPNVN